jgi:hypothetical protein
MLKRLIFTLLAICSLSYANKGTYLSGEQMITIKGEFRVMIVDASITYDEKEHKYNGLYLKKPVNINCDGTNEFCENLSNQNSFQLVLKGDKSKFKKMIGKKVLIKGKFFPSDNGNHFTKFLIDVEDISIQN